MYRLVSIKHYSIERSIIRLLIHVYLLNFNIFSMFFFEYTSVYFKSKHYSLSKQSIVKLYFQFVMPFFFPLQEIVLFLYCTHSLCKQLIRLMVLDGFKFDNALSPLFGLYYLHFANTLVSYIVQF